MTEYDLPQKKINQISARQKRVSDKPKLDEDKLIYHITENRIISYENRNITYFLLVVNLAVIGFLIGMFVSYLFF